MPSVVVRPCTIVVVVRVYAICHCSSVNHCRCRSCVCSYCSCVCSRRCSSVIVCHATDSDVAPSSCVKEGEGERSHIAHLDHVDGDNDMGITIHLSMDGRVSHGGSKCRLVLPHTLQVSPRGHSSTVGVVPCGRSCALVNCGGGSSWPVGHHRRSLMVVLGTRGCLWAVVAIPRSWWWILVANHRGSWWALVAFRGGCEKRVW